MGADGGAPSAVILISLDTLRADRLDLYGYERETAPNLKAFGDEALTFLTASSQATQTLLSHKSMFAAKYPLRLIRETTGAGVEILNGLEDPTQFLINTFQGATAEPLVSRLRDHGYLTAAFTDRLWMRRKWGFDRGFQEFDEEGGRLDGILPRAYDWLEEHRLDRFFLFLHTYDVHCPYVSREPYHSLYCKDHSKHIELEGKCAKPDFLNAELTEADYQAISDHYDSGVTSADDDFGELVRKLRELELYDEALIIVMSDHGDSLGEHGQTGHGGLQLEQMHVPLIMKLPASWNVPPRRVRQPVALVDVMPTVLDALDIEAPGELDGQSVLPLVMERTWDRKFLVAQTTFRVGKERLSRPSRRAILVPNQWLLVRDPVDDTTTVFDLARDPTGLTTLDPETELPAKEALLLALRSADADDGAGEFNPLDDVEIDEALRKELSALGYLK